MIKVNDLFELNGKNYIALDKTMYDNNIYIFTNELAANEEPTKTFKVFRIYSNGLKEEKQKNILSSVLPIFSENMNKKLEVINEYYVNNFEGGVDL